MYNLLNLAFCAEIYAQAMLNQRDFTGKAALHHAVADMEERHKVLQSLLAAKAQVHSSSLVILVAGLQCI